MLTTVLLGLVGGASLAATGMPAGGLIGSVAAVGTYSVWTDRAAKLPRWVRIVARVIMGTVIGSMVTRELLIELGPNVIWAVAFTVFILAIGAIAGLILSRATGMDRTTALMATCPGGMAEMAMISDQLGLRSELVLGVQLVRKILTLVSIFVILLVVVVL